MLLSRSWTHQLHPRGTTGSQVRLWTSNINMVKPSDHEAVLPIRKKRRYELAVCNGFQVLADGTDSLHGVHPC